MEEAPGDLIARIADELEDRFAILRSDPYSERSAGVRAVLSELRALGLRLPVAPLPADDLDSSFGRYVEGQRVIWREEEDREEAYGGVVRRVAGFALQVQATLYGDAGWGKDASGEMVVIRDRRLVRPMDVGD